MEIFKKTVEKTIDVASLSSFVKQVEDWGFSSAELDIEKLLKNSTEETEWGNLRHFTINAVYRERYNCTVRMATGRATPTTNKELEFYEFLKVKYIKQDGIRWNFYVDWTL